MQVKAIVHQEHDGGFWAEVPAVPGCASQGETLEELVANLREAIQGYLTVEIEQPVAAPQNRILDIVL